MIQHSVDQERKEKKSAKMHDSGMSSWSPWTQGKNLNPMQQAVFSTNDLLNLKWGQSN